MNKNKLTKLILMRHGQSQWNLNNLFTGWVDIPLSSVGVEEAIEGGRRIKDEPIDIIFTSTLIRAEMTAMLAMLQHSSRKVPVIIHNREGKLTEWSQIYSEDAKLNTIPVIRAWELNERMYGKLQGVNKSELMNQYGQEQVKIWRRSYDVAPPEGESLAMTANRSIPYFTETILPHLNANQNVFISAHGNSLRSIIMHLDQLSAQEVVKLELPTGEPIIYTYDGETFKKTK